jgi:hypothetical protein
MEIDGAEVAIRPAVRRQWHSEHYCSDRSDIFSRFRTRNQFSRPIEAHPRRLRHDITLLAGKSVSPGGSQMAIEKINMAEVASP